MSMNLPVFWTMMLRDGEQHDFDLFFNLEKLRWGAIRRVCPREPGVTEL